MNANDCIIITTPGGPTSGCIKAQVPSLSWMLGLALINILVILLASWLIYTFLNSQGVGMGFWTVLLILFLALVISNLIFWALFNVV